jgi:hypothetical protein
LDEAVVETVHEILGSLFAAIDLPQDRVRSQALHRWRAHVDQLVELGAAAIDDGELDLTPLGRAGVCAIALDDGAQAPLINDPATLDAATLLRALAPLGESVGAPLLTAWSAARPPAQAVGELLDAARAGTPGTRMTATTVLRATVGATTPCRHQHRAPTSPLHQVPGRRPPCGSSGSHADHLGRTTTSARSMGCPSKRTSTATRSRSPSLEWVLDTVVGAA